MKKALPLGVPGMCFYACLGTFLYLAIMTYSFDHNITVWLEVPAIALVGATTGAFGMMARRCNTREDLNDRVLLILRYTLFISWSGIIFLWVMNFGAVQFLEMHLTIDAARGMNFLGGLILAAVIYAIADSIQLRQGEVNE